MKSKRKDNTTIKFGFVCAGIDVLNRTLIFSPNAKIFLYISLIGNQKQYFCNGMNSFDKENIPFPYNQHEFSEFYGENPPIIANNKEKAVNQLVHTKIMVGDQ